MFKNLSHKQLRVCLRLAIGASIGMTVDSLRLLKKHNNQIRKYNTLVDCYDEALKKGRALDVQMDYMVHLLNTNRVGLTEFDLIAMPSVIVDPPKES